MKKTLSLALVAVLTLLLTACGGTADKNTAGSGNDTSNHAENNNVNAHKVGDTVENEYYRLTLKQTTFTHKILVDHEDEADEDTFGNLEEFFTPTDEEMTDENGNPLGGIHGFYIPDGYGALFLYYNMEFEFIGKEQRSISLDDNLSPVVSYKGDTFDSDYISFGRIFYKLKKDDLMYNVYASEFNDRIWFNFNADDSFAEKVGIDLGSFDTDLKPEPNDAFRGTYEVRGVIQVPEAAAEDKESELTISFAGMGFSLR